MIALEATLEWTVGDPYQELPEGMWTLVLLPTRRGAAGGAQWGRLVDISEEGGVVGMKVSQVAAAKTYGRGTLRDVSHH